MVSLFLRRCLRIIHASAPATSGLLIFSGSPLTDFALHLRHLPRFIGFIAQDTRELLPLSHIIDTPPIAGSALDAGIHTPASAVQVAITPDYVARDRTAHSFPCIFYLHSTLGFVNPQLVSLHRLRCFRISLASHLASFPPPPVCSTWMAALRSQGRPGVVQTEDIDEQHKRKNIKTAAKPRLYGRLEGRSRIFIHQPLLPAWLGRFSAGSPGG